MDRGTESRKKGTGGARRLVAAALLFFALFFLPPGQARAQCEVGALSYATSVTNPAQLAIISAMVSAFYTYIEGETSAAGTIPVDTALGDMEDTILGKLTEFWDDRLEPAMMDMTKELNASMVNAQRQIDSNLDSTDMNESARRVQGAENAAYKQFQQTDEGCRFDTTAAYLAHASTLASAVTSGYSTEFSSIGSNKVAASPDPVVVAAASGTGSFARERAQIYSTTTCDSRDNNGAPIAGCTAGPKPQQGRDVTPSMTLFSRYTLDDLYNSAAPAPPPPPVVAAQNTVRELMFNITGFEPPDPMANNVLRSAPGKEQRRQNREYLAQMDAIGALGWSIVAERTPGQPAPEIRDLRLKLGADPASVSERPSEREIRQSVVEQLWSPEYYTNLTDAPGTMAQKEVYLRAYNLYLLYKIIQKQEKISNVYAIQTGNMLDRIDRSRDAGSVYGRKK